MTLPGLGGNLWLTVEGLIGLFNVDVFGRALDIHTLVGLLRWLGLGLVAFSLRRTFRILKSGGDRFASILFMASAIALAAYLFSTMAINLQTTRYLVPGYIFGAILAGRVGIQEIQIRERGWALAAIILLANIPPFARQLRQPAAPLSTAPLTEWLAGRGLLNGYGTYWSANSATVESSGHVQVRPVFSIGHRVVPMKWESNADWYTHEPAHFLVIDSPGAENLTVADAARQFGPPSEVDTVADRTVLVWAKNITPLLSE